MITVTVSAAEPTPSEQEVRNEFAKAKSLADKGNSPEYLEQFREQARKLAVHFPKMQPVAGAGGTNHFFKVELNQNKTGFAGVRFSVPPGETRSLVGIMAIPKAARPIRWFCIPMEGNTRGNILVDASESRNPNRDGFGARYDRFVPWGKDGDDYITVTQIGPQLKSGDYLLCFSCNEVVPFTLQGAFKLPPELKGGIDYNGIMDFLD